MKRRFNIQRLYLKFQSNKNMTFRISACVNLIHLDRRVPVIVSSLPTRQHNPPVRFHNPFKDIITGKRGDRTLQLRHYFDSLRTLISPSARVWNTVILPRYHDFRDFRAHTWTRHRSHNDRFNRREWANDPSYLLNRSQMQRFYRSIIEQKLIHIHEYRVVSKIEWIALIVNKI